MKANPLIPSPTQIQAREAELAQATTHDSASVVGVSIFGFGSDTLEEQLINGVSGYILAGTTGSKPFVWTGVAAHRSALSRGAEGIVWFDE